MQMACAEQSAMLQQQWCFTHALNVYLSEPLIHSSDWKVLHIRYVHLDQAGSPC